MNKVFKVVYSKSKGCYVVVPETAKNNNGKKKVLASVLAGLALVGGAVAGNPAHAIVSSDGSINTENSRIDIHANAKPANSVGVNSIVVGYQNTTDDNDGTTALGANNQAYGNSGLAVGNQNESRGGASTAIGAGNRAAGAATVAIGNVSNANARSAIAIGSYNNVDWTKGTWQTAPKNAGEYSTVVGNYSSATGTSSSAMGIYTNAAG
ncbi:MAG: ESPR-type extended signal peptide-containing protein, partial [Veillonella nakazawae]